MDELLQVGDVFTCAKFSELRYRTKPTRPNRPPEFDRTELVMGYRWVTVEWTEIGDGGWERRREERMDFQVSDVDTIGESPFEVLACRMQGGQTGRDPWPDGWHVTAREVGARDRRVRFYQSGCFTGMIKPSEIVLVERDHVLPTKDVVARLREHAPLQDDTLLELDPQECRTLLIVLDVRLKASS